MVDEECLYETINKIEDEGELMICKNCNYRNEKGASFCENCGAQLSHKTNSDGKSASALVGKKGLLIGGSVIVALVIVAVILVVVNNPVTPVVNALNKGNYYEALQIFEESRDKLDSSQYKEIKEYVRDLAEQTYSDYVEGKVDYDKAMNDLKCFGDWGFSKVSEYTDEVIGKIEGIEQSRVVLQRADSLMEQMDYSEAMNCYLQIAVDNTNYDYAQSQYIVAQLKYREMILGKAEEYAQKKDYLDAVAVIQNGFDILPNDTAFSERIDTYKQEYVAQVIEQAESYANNEDYFQAIKVLEKAIDVLQDNDDLQTALEMYNWTTVLYSDDDYLIVRKDFETYDSYKVKVGVLTAEGQWIVPLSENHIFANAIRNESGVTTLMGSKTRISEDNVYYMGEGVFIMSLGVEVRFASGGIVDVGNCSSLGSSGLTCYLYNAKTGTESSFSAVWLSLCEDGNMLMYNSNRYNSCFNRVSSEGIVTSLPVKHAVNDYSVSGYSEGLFFANGYFYDIYGNIHIDLTAYRIKNTPYFENGECEIVFVNEAGTQYRATIDKSGAFISDPSLT